MVRVLAVSDVVEEGLRADIGPVRGADLILGCGDLPFEYLGYLMNALDVPLVFVPGNHDPDLSGYRVSRAGLTLRAGLPARAPWPDGAVSADGRVVDVAGLRIAGLGGCRRYRPGPNQYSDRQQARRSRRLGARVRLQQLRGEAHQVDVLLSHAPPLGVGDGSDPVHQGFPALNVLTARLQPAALLHGHVDPDPAGREDHRLGRTIVRNVTGWQLFDLEPGTGRATDVNGHHSAGHHVPGITVPGITVPGTTVLATTLPDTTVPADTGFPRADVENDFQRARRRQTLARLSQRLRREPDDVNLILPFDEVVAALGMTGERKLGLQVIKLDTVVGTVDSTRDFDRRFRPTSGRVRERWERLALAQRRGEAIPPIDVYRVGELHFVVDGHHRVSIALATGQKTIDAYVTEILTAVPARGIRRRGDLLYKSYERLFRSRVKLPAQAYAKISVSDPWGYAELGEAVEAWGFRLMQHEHKFYDRAEVSRRWFADEFTPVVRILHAADLVGDGTDAEAYLTIARERYRLIRTHEWNDEVIEELQRQFRSPRRRGR